MLVKTTLLLSAVGFTGINAARRAALAPRDLSSAPLAELVPQNLIARDVAVGGGWSLALPYDDAQCPLLAPQCGTSWCCPGALACIHVGDENIAEVCCPTNADCSAQFTVLPSCADSSWNLWNATGNADNNASLFCCLQGQVGLQSGYCVDLALAVTAGPPAVELATGVGAVQSGVAASTAAGATGGLTLPVVATTAAATAASTATVKNSPATTASSNAAATVTVVKSGAVGTNSQRGAALGGVVAVAFMFVLL